MLKFNELKPTADRQIEAPEKSSVHSGIYSDQCWIRTMKSIIFLLVSSLVFRCAAQGQIDTTLIDTLQKNCSYVIVGEVISIEHGPILDLGTGIGITTFKVKRVIYQSAKNQKTMIFLGDTIEVTDQHECKESPNYFCSLDKFKKGDSSIAFIGSNGTAISQYREFKAIWELFNYSNAIEKYVNSHHWHEYKNYGICRRYTNRDWNKDRRNILEGHYVSSEVISPEGILLERTIVSNSKRVLLEITEEYDLNGGLQKRVVYKRKQANPWLRRKKYPKYTNRTYYKSIIKEYNGDGKLIKKDKYLSHDPAPGRKF